MNYLDMLAKNKNYNKKKQKNSYFKIFTTLAVLGVVIGSATAVFFAKACDEEIKNVDINNLEDNSDENIDKDIEKKEEHNKDDNNINADEIMETLEHVSEESLGDVGLAMEDAIMNLNEEKKSENE